VYKWLLISSASISLLLFAGCGGNSGGSGQSQPEDFSIAVNPQNLTLFAGLSQSLTVSISGMNGFTGPVNVSISGLPSEVNASSTTFVLSSDSQEQVTFSTQNTATYLSTTLSIQGTSGALSHSQGVTLAVETQAAATYAPIRARYIRTDSFYDPNSLQYAPPHFTAYDSVHKRFFVSNPFLNRIDAFDSAQEVEIAQIAVPGAWGIDVSPDGTALYAGTLVGDVYQIDPGMMQVVERFAASTIGPDGYPALEAFVLASGQIALLSSTTGALLLDGEPSFAIWNPATNAVAVEDAACPISIGAFALSGDRTKVLLGSADSDGTLCAFDPATEQTVVGSFENAGEFLNQIVPTPDGKRFFVTSAPGNVGVYDVATLQPLGVFQAPTFGSPPISTGIWGAVMSVDGSTLYLDCGFLEAYDTTSFAENGSVPTYVVDDSQSIMVTGAVDETGLVVGPIGHGVSFVDASQLQPGQSALGISLTSALVNPTGPITGGTAVQIGASPVLLNNPTLSEAYVGSVPLVGGNEVLEGQDTYVSVTGTTPPGVLPGAADFATVFHGAVGIEPEAFSYGPTVVELVPNASTAEGGTTAAIIGYGLGAKVSDVQVTVGGGVAPVTAIFPYAPIEPYPFPVEGVEFTVPPGAAGSSVDVTVTTANGPTTLPGAFHYASATTFYPLTATLQQGTYDPHRSHYYFTDQSEIQILSTSSGHWLAPIALPGVGASTQLVGVSLSHDGSLLAVSDYGDQMIYVLDPDTPGSAQSFKVSGSLSPTGIAVTTTGIVYFATEDLNGTGGPAFHKLNIATGVFSTIGDPYMGGSDDFYTRVFLSPDESLVYIDWGGIPSVLDTVTGTFTDRPYYLLSSQFPESGISADGTTLVMSGILTDSSLNAVNLPVYVDRETWLAEATIGQKLSSNGSLMFQPLANGIDMIDTATGRLMNRVQMPFALADVYDVLVVDGSDETVAIITANGVALVDLSSLPQPQVQVAQSRRAGITASKASRHLSKVPLGQGAAPLPRPYLAYHRKFAKCGKSDGQIVPIPTIRWLDCAP
jgi:hypothetical protein